MTIRELMQEAHETALEHGWWRDGLGERNFGEQIALMHSELSEALEWYRQHGLTDCEIVSMVDGKPEGIAAEFADVLIRIFDTCQAYGIPLDYAVERKMAYNATRPYRHGGKAA